MSQPAKAQEPSMEEILASIRRIIADDDATKPAKAAEPPKPAPVAAVPARPAAPPPPPAPPPPAAPRAPAPPPPAANKQEDIDAMLAEFDAPAQPAQVAQPDVLDLTESMAQVAPSPSFRTIDGTADVVFTDRAPESPPPMRAAPPPPAYDPAPVYDQALISGDTAGAVDRAFNSLANTVLGNNARTLEDLVKEMLRPMLKGWLDDNLPSLVDRIVRSEIERVSRGGR